MTTSHFARISSRKRSPDAVCTAKLLSSANLNKFLCETHSCLNGLIDGILTPKIAVTTLNKWAIFNNFGQIIGLGKHHPGTFVIRAILILCFSQMGIYRGLSCSFNTDLKALLFRSNILPSKWLNIWSMTSYVAWSS